LSNEIKQKKRKLNYTVIFVIIIYSVVIGAVTLFAQSYFELQEARKNLNIELEKNLEASKKLTNTLNVYADFLFTQNAFDMGYYERISDECFANEKQETYCK